MHMDLPGIIYRGGPITDPEIRERLPGDLLGFLDSGWIAFEGGLHLRGAVVEPAWHSLRRAWLGEGALHEMFAAIDREDVPFAENAFGDQFVLRDARVWKLWAELGTLTDLELGFAEFLADPRLGEREFLDLAAFRVFRDRGGELGPGELLRPEPSFLVEDNFELVQFTTSQSLARVLELARWSRALASLPDGTQIEFGPEF